MNRERVQLWIDALRSGKYKQNHFGYHDKKVTNCFCVLGVAIELYRKKSKKGSWANWFAIVDRTWKYFGLSAIDREYLVTLNDQELKSLPEIADYLEERISDGQSTS